MDLTSWDVRFSMFEVLTSNVENGKPKIVKSFFNEFPTHHLPLNQRTTPPSLP